MRGGEGASRSRPEALLKELNEAGREKWPWWAHAVIWCILGCCLMFTSCTVAISMDDVEQERVEMERDVARAEARRELDEQQTAAIQKLIQEHDYGPMAARCALVGWSNNAERDACTEANRYHEMFRGVKVEPRS